MKSTIISSVFALACASFAQAQTVVNITGATAFRDAAHNALIALLGGEGTTLRARADINLNGSSSASNLRIYRGRIGGPTGPEYIVRATFSGSTQGVLDLADQNAIPFLNTDTTMTTTGNNVLTGLSQAANTTNAAPHFAFSDVDKSLSTRPNASLGGGPVGVVPFMFLAGKGAPAGMTNITDQIHQTLWSTGLLNASFFTGAPSDTTVLATGRNNGSGTRATILSETGYGSFNSVVQWNANSSGAITEFGNSGHTSNSGVNGVLLVDRSLLNLGGEPVDAVFCGYLTISDALTASGYNEATGTYSGTGAIPLTYNGVRYSAENVRNGSYTLWGYQQLYAAPSLSTEIQSFDTALRAAIPANLGTAGIAISSMRVTRFGGDGGTITPND